VTKSCFSQWWPAEFVANELRFATAEHYMMYRKAVLLGDDASASAILAADTPKQAKDLGRKVRGYDEATWLLNREEIVYSGNLLKFSQNHTLSSFLISTNDRILVESSPVDPIWGIGAAEDADDAFTPEKWPGLNLLGFALVRVREDLRK